MANYIAGKIFLLEIFTTNLSLSEKSFVSQKVEKTFSNTLFKSFQHSRYGKDMDLNKLFRLSCKKYVEISF